MKSYQTKQKQLILAYLTEHPEEHYTAEELTEALKNNGNLVGKTTVYRYLDTLSAKGMVRKYQLKGKSGACYQYAKEDGCNLHYHLKCDGCGALFHLDCKLLAEIDTHVQKNHSFEIDNSRTVFYGKCRSCSTGQKEETCR